MTPLFLQCGERRLDLSCAPFVMGVLNITPDSFSDGGQFMSSEAALCQVELMVREGAAIVDVGAESSRPGSEPVCVQQQLDRLVPVVESILDRLDVVVSVDTSESEVMRESLVRGAHMINDIRALQGHGSMEAVAESGACVCLMHMRGEPQTMQEAPCYGDLMDEIRVFLDKKKQACLSAGLSPEQIVVDPGFGFGKTFEHNAEILRRLHELQSLKAPVLIGLSRKSWLGYVLGGADVSKRLHAGVAAAVVGVIKGAHIVRTHDVGPTREALRLVSALAG